MCTKFLNAFAVAALSVLAIACAKEPQTVDSQTQNVSFTIETPDLPMVKAGEGKMAKKLYYQVFDESGKVIEGLGCQVTDLVEKAATVNFQLVKNKTYNFIFWAQTDKADYYIIDEIEGLKKITANYAKKHQCSDEKFDAFYAVVKSKTVTGPISETITLKRPFAQINIATSDVLKAGNTEIPMDYKGARSTVTIKQIPSVFEPLANEDKQLSVPVDVAFSYWNAPNAYITVDEKEYRCLAFNYVFAPVAGAVYDLEATIKVDNKEIPLKVPSIPAKPNWKTNIYGSLLTASADYNVVVNPDFEDISNVNIAVATDKASFVQAYEAGAASIELAADINLDEALILDKDVTIIGKGYKLSNTSEDAIRVTNAANITILDLDITSASNKRCVSFDNTASGAKLVLDGCTLSATHYGINLNQGSENIEISIKNTAVQGWAAIYSYANNSTINVDGATLIGTNENKPVGGANDFATIVFDCNGIVGTYGSHNKMTIENSEIIAKSTSSSQQYWLAAQRGATDNEVAYYEKTTTITDGNGNDVAKTWFQGIAGTSNSISVFK